jgi:hypothetical protein
LNPIFSNLSRFHNSNLAVSQYALDICNLDEKNSEETHA